ncbi:MAG: aminotransferase class-III family protein [Cryobacterium sp.]|nr:aminotransferase class-III family protein [Cryobacterium sp.]
MTVFNFFSEHGLVRPEIDAAEAELMAQSLFGFTGTAHELGSQQDRNFRIDAVVGGEVQRYVLKVDNPAFSAPELAAQNGAMEHLAELGMRVPHPVRGLDGKIGQRWHGRVPVTVRLLTYVDGPSLESQPYLAPSVVGGLGRLSGTVAAHLRDFTADGLDRILQWDLRNAQAVIERLSCWVPDEDKRNQLTACADSALARLSTVKSRLRVQTIHGDITDDNVICSLGPDGRRMPEGVIDFGDLGTGWLVAELAVTAASVLHHLPDEPYSVFDAVVAFDEVSPLTDEDIVALWPLIVLRGAVLVVSGEHQVGIDEGNDYAKHRINAEWRVFVAASVVGWDEAEAAIRRALKRPQRIVPETAPITPMIPALTTGDYEVMDCSVTSSALADGLWLEADVEWQLADRALTRTSAAVVPYGQFRLTQTPLRSEREPATLAMFTEIFLRAGAPIVAPVDGVVAQISDDTFVLTAVGGFDVRIGGIVSTLSLGSFVTAGDYLGAARQTRLSTSSDPLGRVSVQKVVKQGLAAPKFVSGIQADAWKQLAPDPALLLGLEPHVAPADASAEFARRSGLMAAAQERYFDRPPQIERGWREFLVDTTGRAYVDMVNNVAAIGHSHPQLTRAVGNQLQLLNTNSRFLYTALADLCERIVELSPDAALDTVLLVNSGSEAVDLAVRLAKIHTGRRGIVALREGYHGWTMASDAISTSAFDNPHAAASRPDWVHIVDAPNSYRGRYQGDGASQKYVADLKRMLNEPGGPGEDLAGFICEPVLGNAGGVVPPQGYLAGVYEHIRARGGLCIADEVQVGYGRLGSDFWGVQQQGVVPDMITMAKAMGNGFPLGAVLTRRSIAASLAQEGNFFSSSGGSPVSCVAGIAVLDVIRDESLQQNARLVGHYLASRLAELAERHPLIGAVHGMGLYMGVELVRDRGTREPATSEAMAICERLLKLGVVTQPTSERQNVLKIKPPMCLTRESAEFFVDMLDEVLTSGW